MVPVPSLVLIPHCKSDVLVVLSGAAVGVLLEMEEREGGGEDLRDPALPPTDPLRALKGAYMLLFHVMTGACCLSRRRMSGMGTKNSSCVGWGNPGSDHSEAGLTLDI